MWLGMWGGVLFLEGLALKQGFFCVFAVFCARARLLCVPFLTH